jgi:LacI family repressor for deo operon, udp, cdd, tsx, nupC, and nupG
MVSIRQVARQVGVSTATVSRALERPHVVAEATRQKIMAAVAKLGYTPNFQARQLRTRKSHMILVLVPDIGNPFFSEIIKGMEQVAHTRGYSLLLGDTHDDTEREHHYGSRVMARQADGVITLSARIPFRNARELISKGTLPPTVNACECLENAPVPTVQIDNAAAAEKMTHFLLDLGHRRVAFVTGPLASRLSVDRLKGYRKALKTAGIEEKKELIFNGDFLAESGAVAAEKFLGLRSAPTAVFCSNDEMALGLIRTLKAKGLRVPEDMSVAGFDDIPLARYFDPPLTTILQPKLDIGRESMKILCDMLDGRQPAQQDHTLPYQLVVRDSTGRRRAR